MDNAAGQILFSIRIWIENCKLIIIHYTDMDSKLHIARNKRNINVNIRNVNNQNNLKNSIVEIWRHPLLFNLVTNTFRQYTIMYRQILMH